MAMMMMATMMMATTTMMMVILMLTHPLHLCELNRAIAINVIPGQGFDFDNASQICVESFFNTIIQTRLEMMIKANYILK